MKRPACIYQYWCKWNNDGICQHVPQLNEKPVRNVKRLGKESPKVAVWFKIRGLGHGSIMFVKKDPRIFPLDEENWSPCFLAWFLFPAELESLYCLFMRHQGGRPVESGFFAFKWHLDGAHELLNISHSCFSVEPIWYDGRLLKTFNSNILIIISGWCSVELVVLLVFCSKVLQNGDCCFLPLMLLLLHCDGPHEVLC